MTSPVTGQPVPPYYIHADDSCGHFRDTSGRTVLLRGINVNASAKVPQGQPTHKLEGFWESAESGDVSFVGRTFDLSSGEADEHLGRLRDWGFNCFRYIFTWEAIEHQGPGQYDDAFIDYTAQMLKKCKEYGFRVIMDPHQDIFSRFSGGDGAPYWALLAAGMEPRNFTKTNAAIIHAEWPDPASPDPLSLPDMIWATGYQRLAAQTLTTLFFCGRDFAPMCVIDGINIQDYLQQHYLKAVSHLASKLAAFEDGSLLDSCVIGWDSLNEPNHGYVGLEDLSKLSPDDLLRVGPMPTAFQAMQLGMGQAVQVDKYKFTSSGPAKDGNTIIDPNGAKAWLSVEREAAAATKYGWKRDPGWKTDVCIWAQHGLWDPESSTLRKPRYFAAQKKGPGALFSNKYWKEHWRAYAQMIRAAHPEAIHFIHPPVFQIPPTLSDLPEIQRRAAFSTHFYDGVTLVTKHWNWFNFDAIGVLRGQYRFQWQGVKVGTKAIRNVMQSQIGILRQDGLDALGNFPAFMGEIGVPFDLDQRKSYQTGDYSEQTKALDASLNGCDGPNGFNVTLWNYCKDNSHLRGDQWVGEDLSVWSADDLRPSGMRGQNQSQSSFVSGSDTSDYKMTPPPSPLSLTGANNGARGLLAFVRPHPTVIVGILKHLSFDIHSTLFTLDIELPPAFVSDDSLPTEIYLPQVHYGASSLQDSSASAEEQALRLSDSENALEIKVSHGKTEQEGQGLRWFYDRPASLSNEPLQLHLEVKRKGGPRVSINELYGVPGSWYDTLEEFSQRCCTIS